MGVTSIATCIYTRIPDVEIRTAFIDTVSIQPCTKHTNCWRKRLPREVTAEGRTGQCRESRERNAGIAGDAVLAVLPVADTVALAEQPHLVRCSVLLRQQRVKSDGKPSGGSSQIRQCFRFALCFRWRIGATTVSEIPPLCDDRRALARTGNPGNCRACCQHQHQGRPPLKPSAQAGPPAKDLHCFLPRDTSGEIRSVPRRGVFVSARVKAY